MKKLTTEEFIKRAQIKHGDKYDYSPVKYIRYSKKVTILCRRHGTFKQRPNDHCTGYGCPDCGTDRTASAKRSSVRVFITKASIVHRDIYYYSNVIYKNAITKVIINCKRHGQFAQTPDKHLSGTGCPKCSCGISRGEKRIQAYLDSNTITYEREKRFDRLCGATKNSRLRYDFFLPDHNLLIEYDGEQHFKPIRIKGRIDKKTALKKYAATKINDKKKTVYAQENGYKLLRIQFSSFNEIEIILNDQLFQAGP